MEEQAEVFGLNRPLDECDEIFFGFAPKVAKEENYLFQRKWFDYRFMHCVQATYLFAHFYRQAYREAFAKNFDRTRSEHVKGWKGEDIFDDAKRRGSDATGFVRARQHADLLGMPYLEYTRIAFAWAMRKDREYMPRPCHLYNYELLTAIQATWQERQAGQVFLSTHEVYRNGAYQGLLVQDQHHEWILQQAALRSNPTYFLAGALYDADVLPEAKVASRFGADVLARARATLN